MSDCRFGIFLSAVRLQQQKGKGECVFPFAVPVKGKPTHSIYYAKLGHAFNLKLLMPYLKG